MIGQHDVPRSTLQIKRLDMHAHLNCRRASSTPMMTEIELVRERRTDLTITPAL
jgi:hypothetical protein